MEVIAAMQDNGISALRQEVRKPDFVNPAANARQAALWLRQVITIAP
jgi:hypothetical protein